MAIPVAPSETNPSKCPCGCGTRLRLHRKGAGAGYVRAQHCAAQLELVRRELATYPGFTSADDEALWGSVTRAVRLCGSWLGHCHRTAAPGTTPDMLALSKLTLELEALLAEGLALLSDARRIGGVP